MQTSLSIDPESARHELLWVLGPSGWAMGWLSQAQPVLDQSWPQGEPPIDCPALELDWASRQALSTEQPGTVALHLLVCEWRGDGRPGWWPDGHRRLKPWRDLCREAHVRLHSVRSMTDERGTASLWQVAQHAWPETRPLRGIGGGVAMLPRSPLWAFLMSCVLVLTLHLVLTGVVRPGLAEYRQSLEAQARQAREQDTVRQAQARAQAQEAERQTQVRVWQSRQRDALLPLTQLIEVIDQGERSPTAHWWSEMRWSQGAWTIWGATSHEAAWQGWQAGALSRWHTEWIESAPTVWPPSPAWGLPAWRYQVRIQAHDRDDAKGQGGAP